MNDSARSEPIAGASSRGRVSLARYQLVLVIGDFTICAVGMGIAMALRYGLHPPENHLMPYLTWLPLIVPMRLVMAYLFSLYDFRRRLATADHLFGACAAALCSIAATYLFLTAVRLYLQPDTQFSRTVVFLDMGILAFWFIATRSIVLSLLERDGYRIRTVLLGPEEACASLAREIDEHAPPLLTVVETIVPASRDPQMGLDHDDQTKLQEALRQADQLIVVQSDLPRSDIHKLLDQLEQHGAQLYLYPDLDTSLLGKTDLTSIAGIPLIALGSPLAYSPYRVVKQLLDLGVAVAILALTLPITLLAALLIKLSSKGPVLFSQERVGYRGEAFTLHKFRTMMADAEAESGPTLAVKDDPRITPIGRLLRSTRIDELPQMWNVIRGDMSLVGPRPERKIFFDEFAKENPLYARRTLVKPGLTGLAQIHGRYDTQYTDKLRYDLVYINGISFATDLRILLATLRVVVTGRGAH